ncbi:SCP2 domain-containing protein [Thaumasiovibrio sp. DFM-14]|uniref:ubiquinone biosynthesis accessory factor UbiJ n=1 Tax=Thaumasiovibrio sp. DFM-14 TaxID=3384792 RepID=UPI0039A2D591
MKTLSLPTPIKVLLCASLESALNHLATEASDPVLRRLRGRVLQITLNELSLTLTFVFSQQIDVLGEYEGEPDCHLLLDLAVLPQLQQQARITQLIKQGQLDVHGDLALAQQFAELLQLLKPDWEEWLSQYSGDVLAHLLVSGGQRRVQALKRWHGEQQRHIAEVITEEWRLAPGPLEVMHFCDQVDDLRSALAQLEVRLERLCVQKGES